jgi:hypothetical protein
MAFLSSELTAKPFGALIHMTLKDIIAMKANKMKCNEYVCLLIIGRSLTFQITVELDGNSGIYCRCN